MAQWLEVGRFPGIRTSIPTFLTECDTASEIVLHLLESSQYGCKSQVYHLLIARPWGNCLNSASLHFLIHNMGKIIVPSLNVVAKVEKEMNAKQIKVSYYHLFLTKERL